MVYSANLTAVVLVGQSMAWDARHAGMAKRDAQTERESLIRPGFVAGVFLGSIVVALFDASIAPYMWLALFFEGRGQ